MRYETKKRIVDAAHARGSTAKTVRGALKYIRDNLPAMEKMADKGNRPTAVLRLRYVWTCPHDRLMRARILVPLGTASREELGTWAHAQYPRRQNWRREQVTKSGGRGVENIGCGRYSSRCTYTRMEYAPYVASWAIIRRDSRFIEFGYDDESKILEAPYGYYWARDSHGLKLQARACKADDYHPDADDLRDYSKRAIRAKIIKNRDQRRELAREQKRKNQTIADLEARGVWVCAADSVRAGNCREGTRSFARQHGLSVERHYRPSEILSHANGNTDRALLAVFSAAKRDAKERRRGYAVLQDHVI